MKTIKLMTEYVKNGIYHMELKDYTEEEFNKMLQNQNLSLGGKTNARIRKCKFKRKNRSN